MKRSWPLLRLDARNLSIHPLLIAAETFVEIQANPILHQVPSALGSLSGELELLPLGPFVLEL